MNTVKIKPFEQSEHDAKHDIRLTELEAFLGFELPDITMTELEAEIGIKFPDIKNEHNKNDSSRLNKRMNRHPSTKNIRRALGTGALAAATLTGAFVAAELASPFIQGITSNKTALSKNDPSSNSLNKAPELTSETSEAVPEQLGYLDIKPRETFLSPEGDLQIPDYILHADTVGSTIFGYVRPAEESNNIGEELNSTPIDVVTPAIVPQIMTPQLQAYANQHPDFTPTLERGTVKGKKNSYWNGKSAGEFQKTAMLEYGLSVAPGQTGNSVSLLHASTRSTGGGDLPALNIGDAVTAETPMDGNSYVYELTEVEVIDVDSRGNLTPQEQAKQEAKGHRKGVSAHEVIYQYVGHEKEATLTIQICGDEAGVPGGTNGKNAKEARIVYRFKLNNQKSTIHTEYARL